MATAFENTKGFKVIEVNLSEIKSWGGLGICDYCNRQSSNQFYIPVLNSCYCFTCYSNWVKRAVNHPEDKLFEEMQFEKMKAFLEI